MKSILIGSPIETIREKHERLTKTMGLAVFSSDATVFRGLCDGRDTLGPRYCRYGDASISRCR